MFFDLKKKGFLHIFILAFFFHFYGLHWMKLRKGILKITGFFLWKEEEKKEEKTQFLWKKEKILKNKKARTGFEPAIFGFR